MPVRRHAAAETPSAGRLGEVSDRGGNKPPTHPNCTPVLGSHPSQRPEPGQHRLILLPPSCSLAGAQTHRCPPRRCHRAPHHAAVCCHWRTGCPRHCGPQPALLPRARGISAPTPPLSWDAMGPSPLGRQMLSHSQAGSLGRAGPAATASLLPSSSLSPASAVRGVKASQTLSPHLRSPKELAGSL